MLKFPKNELSDAHLDVLKSYFADNEKLLRPGSAVAITHAPFDEAHRQALAAVLSTGHIIQGMELIAKTLDRELKGLKSVQEKTGQPPANRLSRLLLIANDGSERFYRDAEAILTKHGERTWACQIDTTAEELGKVSTLKGNPAKTLLINDRKALVLYLEALATGLAQ